MSKIKKKNFIFVSFLLAIVCGIAYCLPSLINSKQICQTTSAIRTIEVKQNEMDYQSIFDEFEDATLETQGSLTTFEGFKTISIDDFAALDNLSETDIETCDNISVKYNFSYDAETGMVTLSATTINKDTIIEVEEIEGVAFYNEYGAIDAKLEVDGEYVLLSEMQDAGMIANCGWFSKLFKKVVVAVVTVVAVAAVATAVVATCGAGLGACIAAGAIAGGITGGVAGGIISYQETGEVQVWAVFGGIIGGAVLGGLTGWAVGTILGAGSQMTCGFAKGSFNSVDDCINYHFKKHGAEVGAKSISEYVKLAEQTANTVIKKGIPAVRQVSGATANVFRYEVGNFYIHMAKSAKEIIIVSFGLL